MPGDERERQYTGDVVRKLFAKGSKSQRPAVILATRYGEFLLRRRNARALVDRELAQLVGKRIRVRGIVHRHTLTILEWKVVE